MKEKVLKNLKEKNLINEKLAVAVSTGIDSMVLLDILIKLKLDLVVIHLNHQKRDESFKEEEFIKDFCKKKDIKCFVKRLDFESEVNFQAEARKLRYEYYLEVMKNMNLKYLCLAHHADDQIETILMRILRGASIEAISGMKEVTPFKEIYLVRPLLSFSKKEIKNYALKEKIIYFEDKTNSEDFYERNRIRKNVIPSLVKENSKAHEKFLEFSNTLNFLNKLLVSKIDEFIEKNVFKTKDYFSFKLSSFNSLEKEFKEELLFFLLKEKELSKQNINEIIKILNTKKANLKVDYLNFTILKEYDLIYFFKNILVINKVNLKINNIKEYKLPGKYDILVSKKSCNFNSNLFNLCYNIDSLDLTVRNKEIGDRISTVSGTKTLKKLFIDLKVGYLDRENALVVVDNKTSEILLVVGYQKSSKLKDIKKTDCLIEFKEKI